MLIRPDVIWKKISRPLYHVHFTVIHTNSRHNWYELQLLVDTHVLRYIWLDILANDIYKYLFSIIILGVRFEWCVTSLFTASFPEQQVLPKMTIVYTTQLLAHNTTERLGNLQSLGYVTQWLLLTPLLLFDVRHWPNPKTSGVFI